MMQGTDISQVVESADTGQVKGGPAASSRIMSLMKADSWPVRCGGRATMPGSRMHRASIHPRRSKSVNRTSPMSFCAP